MNAPDPKDFSSTWSFRRFDAQVWAENNTIYFTVSILAQTVEQAEAYIRATYPNINDLYVAEEGV